MESRSASRDFDEISAVYDETRQPLDPATIEGLYRFLLEHRWSSVLEVGVGTGRISQPLVERGLKVVGIDASRGMISKARAKGLPNLIQGTAVRLPFRDHSFDVALFVHVLHVLDDAGAGLREASRVSRGGVLAIMDRVPERTSPSSPDEPSPRELLRDVLTKAGYPDLLRAGPRVKEREILERFPPKETRTLSDREITEPLSKQLDVLEKRAYRHVLHVPPDVLARAVAVARRQIGARTVTYRRSEAIVWWPTI